MLTEILAGLAVMIILSSVATLSVGKMLRMKNVKQAADIVQVIETAEADYYNYQDDPAGAPVRATEFNAMNANQQMNLIEVMVGNVFVTGGVAQFKSLEGLSAQTTVTMGTMPVGTPGDAGFVNGIQPSVEMP